MFRLILAALGTVCLAQTPVTTVVVETSRGSFTLDVHPEWAPLGAARFLQLVRDQYFNDSRFFRVREGFIAQFGIAGDAKVAQAWRDRTIADDPVKVPNRRGAVAFAMTGKDTRCTQVYINLADNLRLDAEGFAPFAEVSSGMDVVDRLYSAYGETSGGGMRTGKQQPMFDEGNAWLDRNYPKLDRLIRASVVPAGGRR